MSQENNFVITGSSHLAQIAKYRPMARVENIIAPIALDISTYKSLFNANLPSRDGDSALNDVFDLNNMLLGDAIASTVLGQELIKARELIIEKYKNTSAADLIKNLSVTLIKNLSVTDVIEDFKLRYAAGTYQQISSETIFAEKNKIKFESVKVGEKIIYGLPDLTIEDKANLARGPYQFHLFGHPEEPDNIERQIVLMTNLRNGEVNAYFAPKAYAVVLARQTQKHGAAMVAQFGEDENDKIRIGDKNSNLKWWEIGELPDPTHDASDHAAAETDKAIKTLYLHKMFTRD